MPNKIMVYLSKFIAKSHLLHVDRTCGIQRACRGGGGGGDSLEKDSRLE